MLTTAEIKLVAGILLALLAGWGVKAWRDRQRVEIVPIESQLPAGKTVKHFDHREE